MKFENARVIAASTRAHAANARAWAALTRVDVVRTRVVVASARVFVANARVIRTHGDAAASVTMVLWDRWRDSVKTFRSGMMGPMERVRKITAARRCDGMIARGRSVTEFAHANSAADGVG